MNNDNENTNGFKSFKYKAKLLGTTLAHPTSNHAGPILKNAKIAVPSKYLSNFWRPLKMPLINCKSKSKLIVIRLQMAMIMIMLINPNNNFFIIKTKLHVPVVTLSTKNNQKLSKRLNKGFEKLF